MSAPLVSSPVSSSRHDANPSDKIDKTDKVDMPPPPPPPAPAAAAAATRQHTLMIERVRKKCKILEESSRCQVCWHDKMYCVCSRIENMFRGKTFRKDVHFALYLHETEWLCASDDAKLLCCVAPTRTTLLVHGRPGDDAKLAKLAAKHKGASCLLFPDDDAILVSDFLVKLERSKANVPKDVDNNKKDCADAQQPSILIIVVDATWRRARKMMKHLSRHVIGNVPHIKLETDTVSCYSRTQTQPGRICTVEAISLLLQEMGECSEVCSSLIECVKINNAALKPVQGLGARGKNMYMHGKYMKHPAWYFHSPLPDGKRGGSRGASIHELSRTHASTSETIGRKRKNRGED